MVTLRVTQTSVYLHNLYGKYAWQGVMHGVTLRTHARVSRMVTLRVTHTSVSQQNHYVKYACQGVMHGVTLSAHARVSRMVTLTDRSGLVVILLVFRIG